MESALFDEWPDQYDSWFTTPIGKLVKKYEAEMLLEMLKPRQHEQILDVGCGTGVFSIDVLASGASVIGLDISRPMLQAAARKLSDFSFRGMVGDMQNLPFEDGLFDKVYSMTALEFVEDAEAAIGELNRVTRSGGTIVLTTLNSLSPWAERRKKMAGKGHSLFSRMVFRSPDEMADLIPAEVEIKTAIHFLKDEDPALAQEIEREGQLAAKRTGAFLACVWRKA